MKKPGFLESRRKAIVRYIGWAFLYFHLVLFVGINSLLIVTNLTHNPQEPWFIIPLTFWGLFLFAHFLILFFIDSHSAKHWRDSIVRKEVLDTLNLGLTNEELFKKNATKSFCWMIFYLHLGVYCGAGFIMSVINYLVSPKFPWSIIAIIAWFFWLVVHFLITYIAFGDRIASWRLRKIQSFIYTKYDPNNKKDIYREATINFGFWVAFRAHFLLYIFSNLVMIFSDLQLNITEKHWFYYPLIAWGIFLVAHWLVTFLLISPTLAKWREQKVYHL